MGEVVFDSRMAERQEEVDAAVNRKIRKAIRDGAPQDEIDRMVVEREQQIMQRMRELCRGFLRHRLGREPSEDEIEQMFQRTLEIAAKADTAA